jgi:hypothetical protein
LRDVVAGISFGGLLQPILEALLDRLNAALFDHRSRSAPTCRKTLSLWNEFAKPSVDNMISRGASRRESPHTPTAFHAFGRQSDVVSFPARAVVGR